MKNNIVEFAPKFVRAKAKQFQLPIEEVRLDYEILSQRKQLKDFHYSLAIRHAHRNQLFL